VSLRAEPLAEAYAVCDRLARSHYENFPVASRLLPAAMRPHVAALYAFARIADDLADEGTAPAGDRLARLRAWQEGLHRAARRGENGPRTADRDELVLAAIGHSIRTLDLPLALFDDLVSAFGQDTMTSRYDTWCDVLDYCRRSANPVGRLVLRIAGHADADLDRSSDALCTALQLTNFWQDLGDDWRTGRLYVPREVQDACGATEVDLASGRMEPAWARAIEACAAFTRSKFEAGRPRAPAHRVAIHLARRDAHARPYRAGTHQSARLSACSGHRGRPPARLAGVSMVYQAPVRPGRVLPQEPYGLPGENLA
jgi:hydroxysqualene synthase